MLFFFFQYSLFALEIVGNIEKISLDDFNLSNIEAKIDTGAFYSALDCSYIQEINGSYVEFSPLTLQKTITKEIVKVVTIKSSNGQVEKRFLISSTISINGKSYPILFSLTNRTSMTYKILIGSDFLKNKFLVDVGKQILKD